MAGTDDQAISQVVTDSYDLLYGAWPEEYNQVVLVLDENNSLSTASLYQLGLISAQQYLEIQEQIADGAEVTPLSWDYETICGHTFSLVPASDRYSEKEDGTFAYTADSTPQQEQLVKNGITLTISGVIRPKTDAANATISTPVAYTSQLTDYVELMTQSLTSIVDIISYVLIAFVAVSLVVSCIMIGIITHISVMERTKEIGILRAMGASKRNISQVFNAETFIIGCLAGALGVLVSTLLTIPINAILQSLLDASSLTVALPVTYGGFLVLLSILITMLGGLLPAKNAAKKDPVAALRTE